MQHTSEKMQACIQDCQNCAEVCLETTMHCLTMGSEHAAPDHIRVMLDCAEICQTSANFMIRGSEFHPKTCGVCAEVCQACAESCAMFPDDAEMQRCAEMCRKCARSCQEMASMA